MKKLILVLASFALLSGIAIEAKHTAENEKSKKSGCCSKKTKCEKPCKKNKCVKKECGSCWGKGKTRHDKKKLTNNKEEMHKEGQANY